MLELNTSYLQSTLEKESNSLFFFLILKDIQFIKAIVDGKNGRFENPQISVFLEILIKHQIEWKELLWTGLVGRDF